jgi:hypothetical protein
VGFVLFFDPLAATFFEPAVFAAEEADFFVAFDVPAFFTARLREALELALEAGFVSACITNPGNRLAAFPTAAPIARPAVTRIP